MMRLATGSALAILAACSSPSEIPEPILFDADASNARWADLGRECAADAPTRSAPADSIAPGVGYVDALWADIARRAPGGWGGYFVDEGRDVIYLLDPSQVDAAVAFLRAAGVPVQPSPEARQGRWDFAQMFEWYGYLRYHVWRVGGVSSSDIQEARNRVEYGVVDEAARLRLEEVLTDLEIPCFLVAIGIQPYTIAAQLN